MMPRQMRRSWGTVQWLSKDRAQIKYWATKNGRYRRCSEVVRGTRKQVEDRLAELRTLYADDAPSPTVQTVWREYVVPSKQDLKDATKRKRDMAFDALPFKEYQVDSLRPLEIQQWLVSSDLAPSTVKRAFGVLDEIMDFSVRMEWAPSNPCAAKYIMPKVEHKPKGVYTYQQLIEMTPTGEWWEAAYILQAFGACRVAESLAPRADECRLKHFGGVPVFMAPIHAQIGADGFKASLKNEQSKRTAMVAGPMALRLEELRRDGRTWLTDDGGGQWVPYFRLYTAWKAAHDLDMKTLRSSCETWWKWDAKVPPHVIELLMGHIPLSAGQVTGKHYDRPSDAQIAAALAQSWATSNLG